MRRCASSPSVVNSSSPEVMKSRRPTPIQRPCGGRRQLLEHRGPALRIRTGGHFPDGLVVEQDGGFFGRHTRVQRLTVQPHVIAGPGAVAQLRHRAVDGDPAGADPLFNGAARSVAAAGEQFLKS